MESGWKQNSSRYRELFKNLIRLYNTKPNIKAYLELILTISTVIVFALFAIKPTILTILDLNKEINSKEATVSKLKQKITNLQIANNLLQQEGQGLSFIDQAIPNTAEPDIFLNTVETLAQQNSVLLVGFSITNIELLGKSKDKTLEKGMLPFSLSVSGNYSNLNNFLINLENLRRPFKVESFSFNKNSTENGQVLVLTIAGKLPYYEK